MMNSNRCLGSQGAESLRESAESPGDYPKVLIVACDALGAAGSTGTLMRSLFRDWEPDNLAQIITPLRQAGTPDFDLCNDFRVMALSGHATRLCPKLAGAGTRRRTFLSVRRLMLLLSVDDRVKNFVRPLCEFIPTRQRYRHSFIQEVKSIRPDIIYALGGNYHLSRLVTEACRQLDLPLLLHIADDDMESMYTG